MPPTKTMTYHWTNMKSKLSFCLLSSSTPSCVGLASFLLYRYQKPIGSDSPPLSTPRIIGQTRRCKRAARDLNAWTLVCTGSALAESRRSKLYHFFIDTPFPNTQLSSVRPVNSKVSSEISGPSECSSATWDIVFGNFGDGASHP